MMACRVCVRCVLAALTFVALSACGSAPPIRVTAEANPTAAFSSYHTYDWASVPPQPSGSGPVGQRALLDWRIRNAIDAQLVAKGFVKGTSGRPDFLIDYHLERTDRTTDSIGDYIRYRQSGGKSDAQETFVFGYEEGTLTVEVFDARTRELAWRGSANGVVNPDQQQDRLMDALRQMMQRFPPP